MSEFNAIDLMSPRCLDDTNQDVSICEYERQCIEERHLEPAVKIVQQACAILSEQTAAQSRCLADQLGQIKTQVEHCANAKQGLNRIRQERGPQITRAIVALTKPQSKWLSVLTSPVCRKEQNPQAITSACNQEIHIVKTLLTENFRVCLETTDDTSGDVISAPTIEQCGLQAVRESIEIMFDDAPLKNSCAEPAQQTSVPCQLTGLWEGATIVANNDLVQTWARFQQKVTALDRLIRQTKDQFGLKHVLTQELIQKRGELENQKPEHPVGHSYTPTDLGVDTLTRFNNTLVQLEQLISNTASTE